MAASLYDAGCFRNRRSAASGRLDQRSSTKRILPRAFDDGKSLSTLPTGLGKRGSARRQIHKGTGREKEVAVVAPMTMEGASSQRAARESAAFRLISPERHWRPKGIPARLGDPVEIACLAPLNPASAQKVAEQLVPDRDQLENGRPIAVQQ